MKKSFCSPDWKKYIPLPICQDNPEYEMLYKKAFELAHDHIKFIDGMPQNPYMDEAFCHTQVWIWDTCFMSLFCKFAREVFPGVETFNNFLKNPFKDNLKELEEKENIDEEDDTEEIKAMFEGIETNGRLYYDENYDYSIILDARPESSK